MKNPRKLVIKNEEKCRFQAYPLLSIGKKDPIKEDNFQKTKVLPAFYSKHSVHEISKPGSFSKLKIQPIQKKKMFSLNSKIERNERQQPSSQQFQSTQQFNFSVKKKYLKDLLQIQIEQSFQRKKMKQQFLKMIIQSLFIQQDLCRFFIKWKNLLENAPLSDFLRSTDQSEINISKISKSTNLFIEKTHHLTLLPKSHSNQGKHQLFAIQNSLLQKSSKYEALNQQMQTLEEAIQQKQAKIKQIDNQTKSLKLQLYRYQTKIQQILAFSKLKAHPDIIKLSKKYDFQLQYLLKYTIPAEFTEIYSQIEHFKKLSADLQNVNKNIKNIFSENKENGVQNIIANARQMEIRVRKLLKLTHQLIPSIIAANSEKEKYLRSFQAEIIDYFNIKTEKQVILQNFKKGFAFDYSKLQVNLQKHQKTIGQVSAFLNSLIAKNKIEKQQLQSLKESCSYYHLFGESNEDASNKSKSNLKTFNSNNSSTQKIADEKGSQPANLDLFCQQIMKITQCFKVFQKYISLFELFH